MDHYATLARFNAWVNRRLYDAVAGLPAADYLADRGLFFGSVHRTLDHILVVDRLWSGRIAGRDRGIRALDQALHADLPSLSAARAAEDQALVALVDSQAGDYARVVAYRPLGAPGEARMSVGQMLMALFNHQTHHRGQVTAALSQSGLSYPDLDVPYFIAEQGAR